MNKKLSNILGAHLLSGEKQKMILGGAAMYTCTCNDSGFSWIGEYESYQAALAAFISSCKSGVTCTREDF